MAVTPTNFTSAMLSLVVLIIASMDFAAATIGVAYGTNGKGLPPPTEVVALYKQYGIRRMRIYDTNPETLQALCGSNIEVTVGIPNPNLQPIAASHANAEAWVQANIRKYLSDVRFRHIVVGNEVSPLNGSTSQYVPFVLPAMQNVYKALCGLGIKVTTAIDTGLLYPSQDFSPDKAAFRSEVTPYLYPIIRFLVNTDSPLFASIFPYFAYMNSKPGDIDERYALLDPSYPGVVIAGTGVTYKNLFYAILDSVNAAVEKRVASMVSEMSVDQRGRAPEVKGGETGHSTKSRGVGPDDVNHHDFASVANARTYINNLIQAVKNGTPKRPGQYIETYIFAMFDEDMKEGKEKERHFGLFTPNGQPKYQVNFKY